MILYSMAIKQVEIYLELGLELKFKVQKLAIPVGNIAIGFISNPVQQYL